MTNKHPTLKETVETASKTSQNKRLSVLLTYYQSSPEIIIIKGKINKENYRAAFKKLVQFINTNRRHLFLDLLTVNENFFVNKYLNDYVSRGVNNSCVIKSLPQLYIRMKELGNENKNKEVAILKKIIKAAKKKAWFLIIMDKLENYKSAFQELSHELNAWLVSGCAAEKNRQKCLINDWRSYLPTDNIHRKLDIYLWKKSRT